MGSSLEISLSTFPLNPFQLRGLGLAMTHFIFPFDPFLIFLHPNSNTTKALKNPSFFGKYLRDVLVVSE
jgi:hypothetical protein